MKKICFSIFLTALILIVFSSCDFLFGNEIIPTKKTLPEGTYISEIVTSVTNVYPKILDGEETDISLDVQKTIYTLIVKPDRKISYSEKHYTYYSDEFIEGKKIRSFTTLTEPLCKTYYDCDGTYEIGAGNKIVFNFEGYNAYSEPLQNKAIWEYASSGNRLEIYRTAMLDGGSSIDFVKQVD